MTFPRMQIAPSCEIPRVVVGCWQLSEGHSNIRTPKRAMFEVWGQLVDTGLTTFDCADIYTGVEQLVAEFRSWYRDTRGRDRSGAIRVHTKFVPDLDTLPWLSKRDVERAIDRSLVRLGVEQLDLVQLAWWDYAVPRYTQVAVWLNDLRQAGKIKYLGVTNFDVMRLREMLDAGVELVTHQVQYSLLDRRPEHGMVELCAAQGIKLLCYGTLAGGFLSERYLLAADVASALENRSLVKYRLVIEEFGGWRPFQELLKTLAGIAERHGVSLSAVAVRYVLDRPQVAAAIIGVRNASHVESHRQIAALWLSADDVSCIDAAIAGRGPAGDVFDLERVREGPHGSIMRYNLHRA